MKTNLETACSAPLKTAIVRYGGAIRIAPKLSGFNHLKFSNLLYEGGADFPYRNSDFEGAVRR